MAAFIGAATAKENSECNVLPRSHGMVVFLSRVERAYTLARRDTVTHPTLHVHLDLTSIKSRLTYPNLVRATIE